MSTLPVGTVTFLMTDVVGSTQLWQRGRAAMDLALEQLDADVHSYVERHHGHVIKARGEGDSHFAVCMVAFEDPRAALAFARSVCDDPTLRVRAAVTAGVVDVVEGELSGRAVFEAFVKVKPLPAGIVWASPTVEELVG